jgi:hypothetical protein
LATLLTTTADSSRHGLCEQDNLRWAVIAFAIGLPDAAILVGFGSAPHINVTWFSWFSAIAEIGTGIVFGLAGIQEVNNVRNPVL